VNYVDIELRDTGQWFRYRVVHHAMCVWHLIDRTVDISSAKRVKNGADVSLSICTFV